MLSFANNLNRYVKRYEAIEIFLRTGESDPVHAEWPGGVLARCQQADRDLRTALLNEVRRRANGRRHPKFEDIDHRQFTRKRVEPMVRGLFPPSEREPVLAAIERSVVFLTARNIEEVLLNADYLHTTWVVANLYLGSLDADLLGPDAPRIVGLSENTTCYISTAYFQETDPFADFLVHEAAHLFHNCRRSSIGLPETENKPWPLDIDFQKRETFAYACEFYSRILARSSNRQQRIGLFEEFRAGFSYADEQVDLDELLSVLDNAVNARNGWKQIAVHFCNPTQVSQRSTFGS